MFCNYCGKEINANTNFCKYCGAKLIQVVPQPETTPPKPLTVQPSPALSPEEETINDSRATAIFLREDKDNDNTWRVYKASSKAVALSFLSKLKINRPSYYIVVETPEGNFGKDINGNYQE